MGLHFEVWGSLPFPQSLFFFLVALRLMRDLSSPTRDGTYAPCSGSTREVPFPVTLSCLSVTLKHLAQSPDIWGEASVALEV